MYKYYICPFLKKIVELEFIKDSVKGNHFKVREITFEEIKKAVKEMTSTEDFFKFLPSQEIKTSVAIASQGERSCDILYEENENNHGYMFSGGHTFHTICFLAKETYDSPNLGLYKVANRVLENYSRQQLHNSIMADITKRKVYPLTGNYYPEGLKGVMDYYRLEVDFSDCTLRSYKNDKLIRVRHDYSTVYDLAEFISSVSEEEIIERYLKFDKDHPQKFYPDRFYITDESWSRVEHIYFNPDADSGSQYVVNIFYGADIVEALTETTSTYDFFANLEENCKQYCYDIGDEDYEEVRNKYENEQPSFEGKSFNSMLILCRLALTEEFIKNNLKESEYFGVGIYTLYKIAERFLVGYNNEEFDDNPVEEYPIKPKEKICVASTTVDILDNEYLAEGFIDFDKQEKTLEVAGVVVRREGYVKLSELVEDLQTLEFAEFISLTESEEKLFLESKTPGRVGYYDYEELRKAAGSGKSEDINRLGEWFSLFGARYWNGEYYDADGLEIYPVYQEIDETGDSFEVVGYSTSKPEVIKKYRGLAEKF